MLLENTKTLMDVVICYYSDFIRDYFISCDKNAFNKYYEKLLDYVKEFSDTHINIMYQNVAPKLIDMFSFIENKDDNLIRYKKTNRIVHNNLLNLLTKINVYDKKQMIVIAIIISLKKEGHYDEEYDEFVFTNSPDKYVDDLNNMFGIVLENISVNFMVNNLKKDSEIITLSSLKISLLPDLSNFTKVIELNISYNNITDISMIKNMTNLKKLQCQYTKIISIPIIESLEEIICFCCKITLIGHYKNLISLYCSNNKIGHISFMPKLTYLKCNVNQVMNLFSFPNLTYLDCENNPIIEIPYMENLEQLHFRSTNITHIPQMEKLRVIIGSDCLVALPYLNQPLEQLYCPNFPIETYNMIESSKKTKNLQKKSNIIARFRELYFALKYKDIFMDFLYEKVRRPMIESIYHPSQLLKFIEENADEWENKINDW